jgi:hypothetical protein
MARTSKAWRKRLPRPVMAWARVPELKVFELVGLEFETAWALSAAGRPLAANPPAASETWAVLLLEWKPVWGRLPRQAISH